MSMYQTIAALLQKEDEYKKQWIYKNAGEALVTRVFPTGEPYPCNRTACTAMALSPTMFTPWGKVLGPTAHAEQTSSSQASFYRALKSIPAQFLYDVIKTIFYTIAAIPSLIVGCSYLAYAFFWEANQENKDAQIKFAEKTCFRNVVLAPYFAVAIVVDFLREFCALFSRCLGTIVQTKEERDTRNWPISQDVLFIRDSSMLCP